jgi:predicted TIM-barrel fold metal-dependent hydrolase
LDALQREDEIIRAAATNGISMLIVSCLGAWTDYPDEATIRSANEQSCLFAAKYPERVRWLAYLNPQLNNWHGELERCIAEGTSGIKLWISLKDETGGLSNTEKVLKTAALVGLPVLLHVYNRTDKNRIGEISIQEFARLSRNNPECVMIAAHSGGNWRQSLGMLREASCNAYLDISGGYPEAGMIDFLVKTEGADRILFGSDAYGRSFTSQLAKVIFSRLGEKDKSKVLWKNAAKIFNLKKIPPPDVLQTSPRKKMGLPNFAEEHFCFCGVWPFFESGCKSPRQLQKVFEGNNIKTGFTANLTGMFHLDLLTANRNFLKSCQNLDRIKPLAILNPTAYNWQILVREAASGNFSGGFISPYLHNWQINSEEYLEFFQLCATLNLKLWINCSLSDHRFRHPSFNPRPAGTKELMDFIRQSPHNQYIFQGLGADVIADAMEEFGSDKQILFEISQLTDMQFSLETFLKKYGRKHLVMGSEFPFRHICQVRHAANIIIKESLNGS